MYWPKLNGRRTKLDSSVRKKKKATPESSPEKQNPFIVDWAKTDLYKKVESSQTADFTFPGET